MLKKVLRTTAICIIGFLLGIFLWASLTWTSALAIGAAIVIVGCVLGVIGTTEHKPPNHFNSDS